MSTLIFLYNVNDSERWECEESPSYSDYKDEFMKKQRVEMICWHQSETFVRGRAKKNIPIPKHWTWIGHVCFFYEQADRY